MPVSWRHRVVPPRQAGEQPPPWYRYAHIPLAVVGLIGLSHDGLTFALLTTAVLAIEWPLCLGLAEGVEAYLPVAWTSAAAAYLLGIAILPVYWVASLIGFGLIMTLDRRGSLRAVGIAAESVKRYRGESYAPNSAVDGDLRHSLNMGDCAVRALVASAAQAVGAPLVATILVGEAAVVFWHTRAPVPGRMAPARMRARLARALGSDVLIAIDLLQMLMTGLLLLAYAQTGMWGFAATSVATVSLHAVLKHLNDTRIESESRRQELLDMREELDRRQRLAAIGQTASTVFHQLGRHHGAIGMYAHLLQHIGADESGASTAAREHGTRIAASVAEANRVMDGLLRFGQDRTLNLYPHALDDIIGEAVDETAQRASAARVVIQRAAAPTIELVADKHKLKQALGNVLDNAIDASTAGGIVELDSSVDDATVTITVRDHGAGMAGTMRDRLFTPFSTTKPNGIGLGLVLAKELVEAHGGRLTWHEAQPGVAFTLMLPLTAVAR